MKAINLEQRDEHVQDAAKQMSTYTLGQTYILKWTDMWLLGGIGEFLEHQKVLGLGLASSRFNAFW